MVTEDESIVDIKSINNFLVPLVIPFINSPNVISVHFFVFVLGSDNLLLFCAGVIAADNDNDVDVGNDNGGRFFQSFT